MKQVANCRAILGVDQGLRKTAVAWRDVDGWLETRLLVHGSLSNDAPVVDRVHRMDAIAEAVMNAAFDADAETVIMEGGAMGASAGSAFQSQMSGGLMLAVRRAGLKLQIVEPSTARALVCGPKAGKFRKEEIAALVRTALPEHEFATDDECDAFVILSAGELMAEWVELGMPLDKPWQRVAQLYARNHLQPEKKRKLVPRTRSAAPGILR